jgi:hypothetical protein
VTLSDFFKSLGCFAEHAAHDTIAFLLPRHFVLVYVFVCSRSFHGFVVLFCVVCRSEYVCVHVYALTSCIVERVLRAFSFVQRSIVALFQVLSLGYGKNYVELTFAGCSLFWLLLLYICSFPCLCSLEFTCSSLFGWCCHPMRWLPACASLVFG